VPSRLEQRRCRDESDQLRAGDPQAALGRALLAGVEGEVERRDVEVGEVHGDLRAAVLRDGPTDRLDRLEQTGIPQRLAGAVEHWLAGLVPPHPALLAHVEGDAGGQPLVRGVEVDVIRDEELACADHGRAGARNERRRSEVGLPRRVLELRRQAFVLARPHVREVAALRRGRRKLVEVDGDTELGTDPLAEATGEGGAVVHGHVGDRHERDDVHGSEPCVRSLVTGHVDEPRRLDHQAPGALEHRLGSPTNVITVRLVSAPGSTLSTVTPATAAAAAATAS
jgi:hypothetical protein